MPLTVLTVGHRRLGRRPDRSLLDAETGQEITTLRGHQGSVDHLYFRPTVSESRPVAGTGRYGFGMRKTGVN